MKQGKDIKGRFASYRADVDDETIHMRWEEIREFLPKKKKRRFLLLLPVQGVYLLIALLVAGVGLWTAFYFFAPEQKLEVKNKVKQINTESLKAPVVHKDNLRSQLPQVNKQTSRTISGPKTNVQEKGPNETGEQHPNNEEKQDQPFENLQQEVKATLNSLPMSFKSDNPPKSVNTFVNSQTPGDSVMYEKIDFAGLDFKTYRNMDTDVVFAETAEPGVLFQEKKRAGVEVFSALHFLTNQITHLEETKKNTSLGYSIGAGINYPIWPRLNAVGQVMLNKSGLNYDKEVKGTKEIVTNPNVVTDTIKYVETLNSYRLKTKFSLYLGIGVDYELFNKRRLLVSGSGLVTTKMVNYTYTVARSCGKDTFIYVVPTLFGGSPNSATSDCTEGTQKQTMRQLSFGLTPGLKLMYRLNPKWALFVRPSMIFELSQMEMGAKTTDFKIQQKDLFVQFGIQFWNTK